MKEGAAGPKIAETFGGKGKTVLFSIWCSQSVLGPAVGEYDCRSLAGNGGWSAAVCREVTVGSASKAPAVFSVLKFAWRLV